MKVLFMSPPARDMLFPTLGIAYMTALLNREGHEALIKEGLNRSFEELVSSVGQIKPEIVGITMNTTTRFLCLKMAEEIKKRYNLPIILGGPHPTLMTDQILRNYSFIDYIVKNEGEYACLNLINMLEKAKKKEELDAFFKTFSLKLEDFPIGLRDGIIGDLKGYYTFIRNQLK